MLKIRLLPLLLAAPALFAAPAYAGVQAGDTEIGIFTSISSDNEADTSSFTLQGSFGKFFTDNLEGKLGAAISTTTDAAGDSTGFMDIGGGGDLTLGGAKQQLVPYVGGLMNMSIVTSGDLSGVGLTLDIHAGCKFFLTERASLDLQFKQVGGTVTISDSYGNEFDSDINRTVIQFGVNVYL